MKYKFGLPAIIIVVAWSVTACQTAVADKENSPYYTIPVGSHVTLNRKIHFEPNQVSVYLQYGAIKPDSQLDRYEPYCKFELFHMRDSQQVLEPDKFEIIRSRYEDFATLTRPWQVAGLNMRTSDGGPSFIEYITDLYLKSERQNNVYRLQCLYWGQPDDNHLTVHQIRQALGEIATLELAAQ